jgi:hypothetical protein
MIYQQLLDELQTYEDEYYEHRNYFLSNGDGIDPSEQQQLELIENIIGQIRQTLNQQVAANGAASSATSSIGVEQSSSTASSATVRVVPGAGGYEYEQHADGSIFIVKSPINGVTRIQVQEGTTAYNAILAEIGPFPSTGAPRPAPQPPADEPTSSLPPTGGGNGSPGTGRDDEVIPPGGDAAWDVAKAVQHLKANAESEPVGLCAQYTREAIEAGGVTLRRTNYAKDYGPSLLEVGFQTVNTASYQAGDVVIMQNCAGHDYGHMQMYSGSQWISDYVQRDFWPYTSSRPQYAVYRFPLSGGNGRR